MVGDVVLAPVPFTDLSEVKIRPALVLADVGMGDWVVCEMTSQGRSGDIPIAQGDMQRGRLRGNGWARPGRLNTLSDGVFRRTVGAVSSGKLAEVSTAVRGLFR